MGCYQNTGRALGDILKTFGRFANIKKRYTKCTDAADQRGITVVGLDDRKCWTGENAASSYDKYGKSGPCNTNKKGKSAGFTVSGTMAVYKKDINGKLI